jgi:Tfp pilus assembly protein PilE
VPSYIGFKSKAEQSAAKANVRAAVPAVEAFYADNGTYVGMDNASTAATPGISYYDPASTAKITVQGGANAPTTTSYCISSTSGSSTWYKNGPAGDIKEVKAGQALCS